MRVDKRAGLAGHIGPRPVFVEAGRHVVPSRLFAQVGDIDAVEQLTLGVGGVGERE